MRIVKAQISYLDLRNCHETLTLWQWQKLTTDTVTDRNTTHVSDSSGRIEKHHKVIRLAQLTVALLIVTPLSSLTAAPFASLTALLTVTPFASLTALLTVTPFASLTVVHWRTALTVTKHHLQKHCWQTSFPLPTYLTSTNHDTTESDRNTTDTSDSRNTMCTTHTPMTVTETPLTLVTAETLCAPPTHQWQWQKHHWH